MDARKLEVVHERQRLRVEMLKLRDQVNEEYLGRRVDRKVFPADQIYFTCPYCSGTVDKRLLGDVLYRDSTLCAPDDPVEH